MWTFVRDVILFITLCTWCDSLYYVLHVVWSFVRGVIFFEHTIGNGHSCIAYDCIWLDLLRSGYINVSIGCSTEYPWSSNHPVLKVREKRKWKNGAPLNYRKDLSRYLGSDTIYNNTNGVFFDRGIYYVTRSHTRGLKSLGPIRAAGKEARDDHYFIHLNFPTSTDQNISIFQDTDLIPIVN